MIPISRTRSMAPGNASVRKEAWIPRWLRAILAVPLEQKLLGANLVIVGVAAFVLFGPIHLNPGRLTDTLVVISALAAGALANFGLVKLALRPITTMEGVARRVSEGRLADRSP